MKNIIVTGGAGFIGSHLCEALVRESHNHIISIDNYSTGKTDNHIDGVEYIKGNTKDIATLVNVIPDLIYHLGEYSRVEQSFNDLEKVWASNVESIMPVLEFAKQTDAKLIYAGSSTKFGDGGLGKTQSPYAFTKYMNTELVKSYAEWFGIKYAITYFYNVYGGRENGKGKYATLIARFKNQFEKGEPLTVVKPGNQLRNFTHINDIIIGLVLVGEKGEGDNYGIGSTNSYSVLEVAEMFSRNILWLEERKGNRMDSVIDTTKTEALGWSVKNDVKNYIGELYGY